MAALLLAGGLVLSSARAGGLQLDAYNNTALSGAPSSTTIVASLGSLALPPALLSAEIRGQLTFPHDGRFGFECAFTGRVAVAFVWLDDHEVCVSGAYHNDVADRSSMDGSPAYPMVVDAAARANRVMNVRVQIWGSSSRRRDCLSAPPPRRRRHPFGRRFP